MKYLVATALLALALPAAAVSATSPSGLRGVVLIDPAYPVCKAGQPCTRPAENVRLDFSRNGQVVARTRTGDEGVYQVRLAPGTYSVTAPSPSPKKVGRRTLFPRRAAVLSGSYRRVVFRLDIGIR
jgi:hypothetical protein